MKKCFNAVWVLSTIVLLSCSGNEQAAGKEKTLTDSLMDEVMDGHNMAMAKMGKLTRLEQQTQHQLDSLSKLPAKAQQAVVPYRAKLDSLQKELSYAEFAMDKWMNEFSMDSFANNTAERVKYLEAEKSKVNKVKEAILSSIEKANSTLK